MKVLFLMHTNENLKGLILFATFTHPQQNLRIFPHFCNISETMPHSKKQFSCDVYCRLIEPAL